MSTLGRHPMGRGRRFPPLLPPDGIVEWGMAAVDGAATQPTAPQEIVVAVRVVPNELTDADGPRTEGGCKRRSKGVRDNFAEDFESSALGDDSDGGRVGWS